MISLIDDNFDYMKAVILVYLSWKYVVVYSRDNKNCNALFHGRFRNITVLNRLERTIDGPIVDVFCQTNREAILCLAYQRFKHHEWNQEQIDKAIPMSTQVGGISDGKNRILSIEPNLLLKPLQNNHRGVREVVFYEIIAATKALEYGIKDTIGKAGIKRKMLTWLEYVVYHLLYKHIPFLRIRYDLSHLCELNMFLVKYHGVSYSEDSNYKTSSLESARSHLVLSDETSSFDKPCIIDFKVGTVTFEPNATTSKKEQQIRKYPHQDRFGFRIVGLQVYDPIHPEADATGYRRLDKIAGRNLNDTSSIIQTLIMFFQLDNKCTCLIKRRMEIELILNKLVELRKWFLKNESFAFYASSLLLIYEGRSEELLEPIDPIVKMIDFAHVTINNQIDRGYIHGLEKLIVLLGDLLLNS